MRVDSIYANGPLFSGCSHTSCTQGLCSLTQNRNVSPFVEFMASGIDITCLICARLMQMILWQ